MLRLKGEPALDQVRPLLSEASRATTEPLNAETPIEAFNLFGIWVANQVKVRGQQERERVLGRRS